MKCNRELRNSSQIVWLNDFWQSCKSKESTVFSTKGSGTTGYPRVIKIKTQTSHYILKMISKRFTYLNRKHTTAKLLEENVGENPQNQGHGDTATTIYKKLKTTNCTSSTSETFAL